MSANARARVEWLALCLDVRDGARQGEFWASALGARYDPGGGSDAGNVVGPPGGELALCGVPEAKEVKHRVHLDVLADSIDALVDRGASVVAAQQDRTVMADPEGGEFCAFVRQQPPSFRLYEVAVDAVDAESLARWWAERFGVPTLNEGEPWWSVPVPGAAFDTMTFESVPEPKTVKNRVHWDVSGVVPELEAVGATRLWESEGWTTMADPEGNEFCVFPAG